MFALIIKFNGVEIARQMHATWDAAHVASLDLVTSFRIELQIVEVESA